MALVAVYKLNEGSGTTINDSSGNGYTATAYNSPVWTQGIENGALDFTTSTMSVRNTTTYASIHGGAAFSCIMAIKKHTDWASANNKWIYFVEGGSYQLVYLYIEATTGNLISKCGNGTGFGTSAVWTNLSSQSLETWHTVGLTWSGTAITLYFDGVAVATGSSVNNCGAFSGGGGGLSFGNLRVDANSHAVAKLDNVILANHLFSAAEMKNQHIYLKGLF